LAEVLDIQAFLATACGYRQKCRFRLLRSGLRFLRCSVLIRLK